MVICFWRKDTFRNWFLQKKVFLKYLKIKPFEITYYTVFRIFGGQKFGTSMLIIANRYNSINFREKTANNLPNSPMFAAITFTTQAYSVEPYDHYTHNTDHWFNIWLFSNSSQLQVQYGGVWLFSLWFVQYCLTQLCISFIIWSADLYIV